MTYGTVFVKSFAPPPFDRREILRYASCGAADGAVTALMEECIAQSAAAFSYKVCYSLFPVEDGAVDMGFAKVSGGALGAYLSGCKMAAVFAATVGVGADRLIARYSAAEPSRALMLDAIGTERVEALCDAFCEFITDGAHKARFSPGYGGLPLAAQKDIFTALEPQRRIGVGLTQGLMMAPSKSVTAIVRMDISSAFGDKI
jgi:hypothetical protein